MRASPGLQYYRVLVDGIGATCGAVPLYQGGDLYGARTFVTYPAGSRVLVLVPDIATSNGYRPNDRPEAFIISALPTPATSSTKRQGDNSLVHTLCGWLRDVVHSWDNTKRKVDIRRRNYNTYQPLDGLTGEWGVFSPMGPAMFQGLLMAFLRGSDRCGVWAFQQDDLLRLMGKNLELMTFSREVDDSSVSGELSVMENTALYPWEGLGSFDRETPVAKLEEKGKTYDEGSPQTKPPLQAAVEQQRAIFRQRRLRGYPGDLDQMFVCLPTGDGTDRYGQNEDKFPGVFRQSTGPDGSFLLQSAKSLTLEKTLLIPYPIEVRKANDPAGDLNPVDEAEEGSEYLASGVYSIKKGESEESADPHQRFDFKGVEGEKTAATLPMLGLELHGFRARETIKNLLRHDLNWKTPEEMDASPFTEDGPAINVGAEFVLDQNKQFMPLPRVKEMAVDHRYPLCKYYASRSAIEMLDDGSVVIEDGYGSQIIMTGGNIHRHCANDMVDMPGRSSIVAAPKDIVRRAGRDMDLTSSYGDLRLKAEYNLMAIGGNAGDRGGVLIESRNKEALDDYSYVAGVDADIQGLVLSNPLGTVGILGQNVVVQAGTDTDAADEGILALLAGNNLHMQAQEVLADARTSLTILAGADGDEPTDLGQKSIYRFSRSAVDLLGAGTLYTDASITSSAGMTATGFDDSQSPSNLTETLTSRLNDDVLPDIETAHRELLEAAYNLEGDAVGDNRLTYFNTDEAYQIKGSLRTEKDYGTDTEDGFMLYEARWQQMARAVEGVEKRYWTEPAVTFKDEQTAPWPGLAPWAEDNRFVRIKDADTNFDMSTGKARRFDADKDDTEDQVGLSIEVAKGTPASTLLVNFEPTER